MTIERLHFEEPQQFRLDGQDPIAWAVGVIAANFDSIQELPEGEYDLTPSSWKRNASKHNLIVRPDGDGIYRMIPLYKDTGVLDTSKNPGQFVPGGKTQLLPQDVGLMFISSPSRERSSIQVHEVIFHIPGPSPRRRFSRN
jgi:hypothetical protein